MALLDGETESDPKALSDEDVLVLSVVQPSIFAMLVERYEAPFLRRAGRVLREREAAADAVQETFTKIYLNASRFKQMPGASFKSWAYKILLNTCFTHWQRRKRDREFFADVPPERWEMIPDVSGQEERRELADYTASILTQLPKQLARVLSLHFLEGKSHKEIAREEGLSIGAVKTRVYRAKRAFSDILSHML